MFGHFPGMKKKEVMERLEERFEKIGLDTKRVLNSYPVELSGGMKQRVVIGLSTLMNPKVVIADEPTSALDVSTQKSVIEMIFNLMDQEIISSMIFITHELPLLKHVANNIAIMYAGEFVEHGTTEQVLFDPVHPYTKALMQSMMHAEEGAENEKPVALEGAPPNLKNPPQGCRFAARCPIAKPDCSLNSQYVEEKSGREVRCMHV
jgi:peptide/nickel transport system ATP-binding protein